MKTFSRGGSDITGALIASALNAEVYENWTDVSGLMMADPRKVENPPVIPEITYKEIRELAALGANVFHEEAIAPIRKKHIPIHIKNTDKPHDEGTWIRNERDYKIFPIVGVAAKTNFLKAVFTKFLMVRHPKFTAELKQELQKSAYQVGHELMGLDTYTLFLSAPQASSNISSNADAELDEKKTHQEQEKKIEAIGKKLGAEHTALMSNVSLIGVVGEGLDPESSGNLYSNLDILLALRNNTIPVHALNIGGSPYTVLIAVDAEKTKEALRVLTQAADSINKEAAAD